MDAITVWTNSLPARLQRRELIFALQDTILATEDGVSGEALDARCPLTHSFGDGIYMRQIFIPAGMVIVGKIHKHRHPNMLMSGEVLVVTESEGRQHLVAPCAMISPAGTKRAVVALQDSVWITVHVTNSQNLVTIEQELIAPSYEAFYAFVEAEYAAHCQRRGKT